MQILRYGLLCSLFCAHFYVVAKKPKENFAKAHDVVLLERPNACTLDQSLYFSEKQPSGVYKKQNKKDSIISAKEAQVGEIPQASFNVDTPPPQMPQPLSLKVLDTQLIMGGKYRPELFYGQNLALLNHVNKADRVLPIRHTFDFVGHAFLGKEKYGKPAVELRFALRNKGIWGNTGSIIPTTESTIRVGSVTTGAHRHNLGRHVLWLKELWLKGSLSTMFGSEDPEEHIFKLGFHPFILGNGITLGPAYALNPGFLGFYTDNVVDQFTPGLLFSGEAYKDRLTYDVYGAILENLSDRVATNAEEIYKNAFGYQDNPSRGFGSINWLVAARLKATPFILEDLGTFRIEPYLLYDRAPEQRIEFQGGAESKFGSVGFRFSHFIGDYDFNFEVAKNFGHQKILGWDRNQQILQVNSSTGSVEAVYTHVYNADGTPAAVTSANAAYVASQRACDCHVDVTQWNGTTIPDSTLVNASNRFRPCFQNQFNGWMCVADASFTTFDKQLMLAFEFGYASGDDDPNLDMFDNSICERSFSGFVGLQEIFNGNKVESAYVLGQRTLARPLTLPNSAMKQGRYASTVASFTNVSYLGAAFHIKPKVKSKLCWRPNIMMFWQPEPTLAFDASTATTSDIQKANSFLGIEINSFVDANILENLKAFFVVSAFFPGSHYDDIRGTPLNNVHLKLLDRASIDLDNLPLLGTDTAFSFNMGLEYQF
ncbi:hypothetical protein JW872_01115 [Candidatus Babeliales bacterium]|nr:hypothetical protein [Candidatus Babeliales bacterium]